MRRQKGGGSGFLYGLQQGTQCQGRCPTQWCSHRWNPGSSAPPEQCKRQGLPGRERAAGFFA